MSETMNTRWILTCSLLVGSFFTAPSGMAQAESPPFGRTVVPGPLGTQPPIILPETGFAGGCGSNLIMNGDFEDNSAVGCDFDLSNSAFASKVNNALAFGDAQEIDVLKDPAGCGSGLPPVSGVTKLGITRLSGPGGRVDAFSLDLWDLVEAGQRYHLRFFAAADPTFSSETGAVEVGISLNPIEFGARVAIAFPSIGSWTQFDFDFVAPVTGLFLTVRAGDFRALSHIDAFSLVPRCNFVLNGDFEKNTAVGCDFNLTNAMFDAAVSNAKAFGDAQEIDVMRDPSGCAFGLPPVDGTTKVAIARQSAPGGPVDAFSLELGISVVAGQKYHLQFFAVADVTFTPDQGAVEVGISTTATDFGTLIATGVPGVGTWSQFDFEFIAPVSGSFLTVREGDFKAWSHLDAFTLEPMCISSASSSIYGSGWPGTNGVIPRLRTSAAPRLCGAFNLELTNSRSEATLGVLFLGLAPADIPSSYGGHLLLLPATVVMLTLPADGASLPAFVPCNEALCGLEVYLQAWESDPGASHGVSFTRGLKLVLGS